jgi:alkylhydroperoxidase family enzyme
MNPAPRIAPLEPPYEPATADVLAKWMPPGSPVPPLALFRTLARHPMLAERMRPLGSGLLAKGSLPPRVRELLVLRTSARTGNRYEWGVHAAAFAAQVGLEAAVVDRTVTASPSDVARGDDDDDDAVALRFADELHDHGAPSDAAFEAARARWGEKGALEMAAVVGFYHLIAFLVGTARVADEPWAAPFPTHA